MKSLEKQDIVRYKRYYSDQDLWRKIRKIAGKAGAQLVYASLLLYYTLQKSTTPKWAKAAIIGALGYLILPMDAIPDLVPMLGLGDDLGVLVAALATVAVYVDDDVKNKARVKVHDWFGDFDKRIEDKIIQIEDPATPKEEPFYEDDPFSE